MKKIPIGIDDFKKIRENNYYYIDKTNFIEEIGKNVGKTLLFTRPRRFGKTLNMSTLKYFFDVENKEENKKLFKSENIPAFITLIIPVIIPILKYGLVFRASP